MISEFNKAVGVGFLVAVLAIVIVAPNVATALKLSVVSISSAIAGSLFGLVQVLVAKAFASLFEPGTAHDTFLTVCLSVFLAISSFTLTLPKFNPLWTKLALVLNVISVVLYIPPSETPLDMPLRLILATVVGAVCAIIACLVPFGRFSSTQVRVTSIRAGNSLAALFSALSDGLRHSDREQVLLYISKSELLGECVFG